MKNLYQLIQTDCKKIFNKELQDQLQLSLNLISSSRKNNTRSKENKNNLFPLFESNKSTITIKSEKTTVRDFF